MRAGVYARTCDTLGMIPHFGAIWPRARRGNIGSHQRTFSGDALEYCPRRGCNNRAARTDGSDRVMPPLLASNLCVSSAQRLRHPRRAGLHTVIFPAPVGKRDPAARLAREGAVPEFSYRRLEALPGSRANATAYVEARRRKAIHLNGRTS